MEEKIKKLIETTEEMIQWIEDNYRKIDCYSSEIRCHLYSIELKMQNSLKQIKEKKP